MEQFWTFKQNMKENQKKLLHVLHRCLRFYHIWYQNFMAYIFIMIIPEEK